ncbi:hypothetical protein ES705_49939 [subsurface metagenome]
MKSQVNAKIQREEEQLEALLTLLPDNPIPWLAVVKLVAPVIARLAARYALKRVKRGLAEDKVNEVANSVGALIRRVVG